MRSALLVVFAVIALPMLVWSYTLTPGYDGSPAYWLSGVAAGDRNYVVLYPGSSHFRADSAQIWLYRNNTGAGCTFNVKLYRADGSGALGDCGCTTAPGTLVKTYGPFTATTAADFYPNWKTVNLNPDTVVAGPFILAFEFITSTLPNNWGFFIDYSENLPACCDQYWYFQSTLLDNEAVTLCYPDQCTPGVMYMAAMGVDTGLASAGRLAVNGPEIMGGAILDSTVTDTLFLRNIGGTTLTVTNVSSSNPDFGVDPIGAGIVIPPMTQVVWPVNFTPSVAGDRATVLSFTDDVPLSAVTTTGLSGYGVDTVDLAIFENWWNINSGWEEWRFDSLASQSWFQYLWYSHSAGWTNLAIGHDFTMIDSFVTDVLVTPWLTSPVGVHGASVTVNFRELVYSSAWYEFHGLCSADSDSLYVLTELPVAGVAQWVDYPTTWYITGLDSAFRMGFMYRGDDADVWFLDDILIEQVPPAPPIITDADPRGDAFDSGQELTIDAFDPNNDPFTATAYVNSGAGFVAHAMTETPAGSGHFCLTFSTFLDGAGTYDYYIECTDVDGTSRFPAAGSYTFEVQAQTGATAIAYHNTAFHDAHIYFDYNDMDAVRFTPPSYPFTLTGATIGIYHGWPDAAHQQIEVRVYDDDGASGLPGTQLWSEVTGSIGNECSGYGTGGSLHYAAVVIDPMVTVTSGDVYIAVKNTVAYPNGEGIGVDSLVNTRAYWYDAGVGTWALSNDTTICQISAIGYPAPAAPVLAVFTDPGNVSASVYVDGVSGGGAISATNIYVATTWGVESLLPGSPFVTSPVTYTYGSDNVAYFSATKVFGPTDLMMAIPPTDSQRPVYSFAAPATGPARAIEGDLRLGGNAVSVRAIDIHRPMAYTVDDSGRLVAATSVARGLADVMTRAIPPDMEVRGPVRALNKGGAFFTGSARVK